MKWLNLAPLFLAGVAAVASAATAHRYRLTRTIPVETNGAWDYIVFDQDARRLYVPHGTRVEVIDPDSGKSVGVIEDTPGVHGISIVKQLNQGFTTNGRAGTVSVVDLHTLKHVAEIKAGEDPDSILFEPLTGKLFVSNGESDDITVIDPTSRRAVGTIPMGGAPEYSASDGAGRMWVNVEDKNSVVEIDPRTLRTVHSIPVDRCSQPTSMAFDGKSRRLFLGCRNKMLAVVDPDSFKTVATLPIGEHIDGTVFDQKNKLLFASSGDGFISVFHQDSPDRYSELPRIDTLRGAKTIAMDRKNGTLYLPTMRTVPAPAFGPPRASGPLAYSPSPFEILVFQKDPS